MPMGASDFVRLGKTGPIYREIGALTLGRLQFVDVVAGDADQKVRGRDSANGMRRHRSSGQMNAVRAAGQSDIGARVH